MKWKAPQPKPPVSPGGRQEMGQKITWRKQKTLDSSELSSDVIEVLNCHGVILFASRKNNEWIDVKESRSI